MHDSENERQEHQPQKKLTLWQFIGSLLAGAIGVQSSKNRERDFQHGSLKAFIIGGVIFTALFVIAIVILVNFLVSSAQ